MKKSILFLLITIILCTNVCASNVSVDVDIETRLVTIDVNTDEGSGKEVGVYITGKEDGRLNYIAQDYSDYDGNVSFLYKNKGDTGYYRIKTIIDGSVYDEDIDFAILSTDDEKNVVQACDNQSTAKEKLFEAAEYINLNLNDYDSLDNEKQAEVFDNLTKSAGELKNIKDVADAFYSSVIIIYAKYEDAADVFEKFSKKDDYLSCMGFDLLPSIDGKSVYDKLDESSKKKIITEVASKNYETAGKFKKALPLETLKEYLNAHSYWKDCEQVIEAYYDSGLVDIEYSKYKSKTNKSDIIEKIKEEDFDNFSEFEALFNNSLTENGGSGSGNGGSSKASGSSSGRGSSSVTIPVVANKPLITPEKADNKIIKFTDIDEFTWASAAIENLQANGIVSGNGDNHFEPARKIVRAEAVKMFVTMFDLADESAEAYFDDVSKDDWSYIYVASAYKNEIVNGKTESVFGVNDNITREEIITIAYRLIQKYNLQYEKSKLTDTNFNDAGDIAEWAKEAAMFCRNYGIVIGRGNNCFDGKADVTRAEAAVILNNVYKALK